MTTGMMMDMNMTLEMVLPSVAGAVIMAALTGLLWWAWRRANKEYLLKSHGPPSEASLLADWQRAVQQPPLALP